MIASWSGFNQEDALVMKKDAIERGAGVITTFRVYSDELNSKGNDDEGFGRVDGAAGMKHADYTKIEADGVPAVGTYLEMNDVVIGKTSQTVQLGPDGRHVPLKFCRSTLVREPCVVDSVIWTCNKEGKDRSRSVCARSGDLASATSSLAAVRKRHNRLCCAGS